MRHILVPTDFSEYARAAFDYAVELCEGLAGRITLLHVSHVSHMAKLKKPLVGLDAIQCLPGALERPTTTAGYAPSFNMDELHRIARRKLDGCATSVGDDVPIQTSFTEGCPALEIVEYARGHDVDVIVMGTRARGNSSCSDCIARSKLA